MPVVATAAPDGGPPFRVPDHLPASLAFETSLDRAAMFLEALPGREPDPPAPWQVRPSIIPASIAMN